MINAVGVYESYNIIRSSYLNYTNKILQTVSLNFLFF